MIKHGLKRTRFYSIWQNMKTRCFNSKSAFYLIYGGRGITVCENWLKFENFKYDMYDAYLKHVNKFGEKNTTLDRINNDEGYFLTNVRWTTIKEQQRNKKNNVFIEYKGKKKILSDWATEYGINERSLHKRIYDLKWPLEKAFQKSRNPQLITFKGLSLTFTEWSKKLKINYSTLKARERLGYSLEKILSPKKLT